MFFLFYQFFFGFIYMIFQLHRIGFILINKEQTFSVNKEIFQIPIYIQKQEQIIELVTLFEKILKRLKEKDLRDDPNRINKKSWGKKRKLFDDF